MVIQKTKMTDAEFDAFIRLPENADKMFEYIGGEIVEVVSNNYSAEIGMLAGSIITLFVRQRGLGRVTGADGGYWVAGERYIPDVAYISKARQPEPCYEAYNPNAPDLAVEVLSPSNEERDMRIKIVHYLKAGTTVWLIDPDKQQVEVYTPDMRVTVLGIGDTLHGGGVLPEFALAVKELFPA